MFDEKGATSSPAFLEGLNQAPREWLLSFKKSSVSANFTHFLSRTQKANASFERADELMNFNCLGQKFKNVYKSIWTKKLPFFSLPETQQQQNIIIRTMIRIKSNENETASRTIAQVGSDVPDSSISPRRSKEKKKDFSDACPCLGFCHKFCHTIS